MASIKEIWNRLTGVPNTFDQYVLRSYLGTALYPDASMDTYLSSYLNNSDVFTIINKKNEPASAVPIYQYDKNGEIVENGRMIARLNKPNPYQSRSQFIESALTNYDIFGESFTAGQFLDAGLNVGEPVRLDILPPKWVTVEMGTVFNPVKGYSFHPLAQAGRPDYLPEQVFHWKEFNPDYDMKGGHLRGMSRLRPLIKSVVGSTEAYNSLVKAFQNQGAWGLLAILDDEGKTLNLNKEQKSILKTKFKRDSKHGDLTITSNKAEWTKIGLTMVELEILKSIGIYKGNIADAYNVPNQLLSGSQDRTYNNYREAEQALWRNAIQPSLDAYLEGLTNWMAPKFKEEGQVLKADYSQVACLQANRVELVQWMKAAETFTGNQILEALGYEASPDPAMDLVFISAGKMPINESTLSDPDLVNDVMKSMKLTDYRK